MVTIDSNLGPDLYIRPERTKIPTISDNLFWTEVFFLSENDRMRCELRYSHAFYVLYFQASCLSTKNWLFIAFRPYFLYKLQYTFYSAYKNYVILSYHWSIKNEYWPAIGILICALAILVYCIVLHDVNFMGTIKNFALKYCSVKVRYIFLDDISLNCGNKASLQIIISKYLRCYFLYLIIHFQGLFFSLFLCK